MQKDLVLTWVRRRNAHKAVFSASALIIVSMIAAGCLGAGDSQNTSSPAVTQPPTSPPAEADVPLATRTPTFAVVPSSQPSPSAESEVLLPNLAEADFRAAAVAYSLPLTIRHVTTDRATLFFELNESVVEGSLYYQPLQPLPGGQAQTQAISLTPGEARQQITLADLSPGAEYLAVVGLSEADGVVRQPVFLDQPWGSMRFRTASAQEPLRFGVFGDASFGDPATAALVQVMAVHDLDFVIHTGDVVAEIQDNNNPVEAYALKFFQTLAPLLHRMPVYTVIGNHDQDAAARWQDSFFYYYAFPPFPDSRFSYPASRTKNQYYAFENQGVQFMMLDSQVLFGAEGREEQEAWLNERLADPQFRITIPVFHVPPFFSGSVHPTDQLPVRQLWHPLFTAERVPLAFSGHSHHYERLQAGGITYIVSGGGSGILYAAGEILPESQIYARRTHFVLGEIFADRIQLTAIDKDGEIFDQTVIQLQ